MRLIRIEMQGFKSFADQTAMLFDDGVTAIVGPNGCGKSNVSDAVRWVLGEQRARILRGARMEEVIFQGSTARRAVNVAEVSLVFENNEGILPTPFREVVVTRRLSRSGESDYLLNGAECRLRDVNDMLRGTGLGADAGVVIEQRMIDALLSDRPDDRRELFEEAAGIGLYRDRRRSTERRLEETGHDLARLDDLIAEVQTQVRSLARQRKRAERHAELTAKRFDVDLTLAARDMKSWLEELESLEGRLAELRESTPRINAAVEAAERGRDEAHGQRASAEAQRNELARQIAVLRESVQSLRSEIAVAEERHRNAQERRRRAEEEQYERRAVGSRLQQGRVEAHVALDELAALLEAAEGALSRASDAESAARDEVSRSRGAVVQGEQAARELEDRVRKLEHDREAAIRELNEVGARTRNLDSERGQLMEACDALAREIAAAASETAAAQARADDAARTLERARTNVRMARDADFAARAELGRAEDLHTALEGRVSGLEGLERERVGLAPAAARLLRERQSFGDGAVLGPISDFVIADPVPAAAVERFLGMTVHAVLVRDRAAAEAVREWHARVNPGALLLLPLDVIADGETGEPGDLLNTVDAAPEAGPWVQRLLGRVRAIADGAFVDPRGAIWLPGTPPGPGPLRRRAELFALRAELQAASAARRDASSAADAARAALLEAESAATEAEESSIAVGEQARQAAETQAELDRRKARYQRDLDHSRDLSSRLSARAAALEEMIALAARQLDDLQRATAEHAGNLETARAAMAHAERGLDLAREARSDAQVALAQAQARRQVATDRERHLAEEQAAASDRLVSLEQELAALDSSSRSLSEQVATWQAELNARLATLGDGETHLDAAERAVAAADAAVTETDRALDSARREARQHADLLHQSELRFTELSGRRTAIRERLEAEWHRPVDELLTTHVPLELDDDLLRQEAESLRAQLEALGPVNPLAIEEHEEEQKRLTHLTSQRNDLNDAKNSLQAAIREIDASARALFLGMFEQARENFRQIFMTLFGGGDCDLRLENPDTPLDCDIEIHASPRGKRTQRINLLSSGERALVALSLLFGIFLTKPSPFCLLDEVDAPLDDANIGRFVRMLNEFKRKTQFIVITHNPRTTTEAADAVYGITMQEPGVSSVVSVRMRGAALDEFAADDSPLERAADEVPLSEAVAAPL